MVGGRTEAVIGREDGGTDVGGREEGGIEEGARAGGTLEVGSGEEGTVEEDSADVEDEDAAGAVAAIEEGLAGNVGAG